jgi:hypothetical protein
MLNKDKAFEILSEAIRVSPADETEVILRGPKRVRSDRAGGLWQPSGRGFLQPL